MAYKQLIIFVEGRDDMEFFTKIIKPIFEKTYNWVEIRQYARFKKEYIIEFIKNIKSTGNDYIYVTDINRATCITAKKQKEQNIIKNIDEDKIIIVIREIESWYLAGLDDEDSEKLKINSLKSTNDINKEQFNKLISDKFGSKIDCFSFSFMFLSPFDQLGITVL